MFFCHVFLALGQLFDRNYLVHMLNQKKTAGEVEFWLTKTTYKKKREMGNFSRIVWLVEQVQEFPQTLSIIKLNTNWLLYNVP